MIRLLVVVEGSTEESFVRHTLAPHLVAYEVFATPIVVTTRRDRLTGRKLGKGGGHWKHWRKDLRRLFLDRSESARFTTLFDLYGLPSDFPQVEELVADTTRRAELLEAAMVTDLEADQRFVPYLQRHEFEALVLAGLGQLESVLDAQEDVAGLEALRREIAQTPPEDVDDGEETAPSKRLQRCIPSYQKTLHGPLVAEALGLAGIRALCPRFDRWVTRLELLARLSCS